MQHPDLVIFGCEGVLVDAEPAIARASSRILALAGIEIPPEEISELYAGSSFQELLLALERESGKPVQASLIDKADQQIDERLQREAKATSGVQPVLSGLPKRAVVSDVSRKRLEIMLQASGLASLFDGSVFSSRDMAGMEPKPAPDLLLAAAAQMQAEPAESFVVESTARGIRAATAAGMRAIGYTGASHSHAGHADILTDAGAETVIHRWSDLPPVLMALGQWREA